MGKGKDWIGVLLLAVVVMAFIVHRVANLHNLLELRVEHIEAKLINYENRIQQLERIQGLD